MPALTLKMLEGRTREQKAELAADLTATVSRILNIDAAHISCLIEELPPENWASGGITKAQQLRVANPDGEPVQ